MLPLPAGRRTHPPRVTPVRGEWKGGPGGYSFTSYLADSARLPSEPPDAELNFTVPAPGASGHDELRNRVLRREKQLEVGRLTAGYRNYLRCVPREARSASDPAHLNTPRSTWSCSKRQFDFLLRRWRQDLHLYWDPDTTDSEGEGEGEGGGGGGGGEEAEEDDAPSSSPSSLPRLLSEAGGSAEEAPLLPPQALPSGGAGGGGGGASVDGTPPPLMLEEDWPPPPPPGVGRFSLAGADAGGGGGEGGGGDGGGGAGSSSSFDTKLQLCQAQTLIESWRQWKDGVGRSSGSVD